MNFNFLADQWPLLAEVGDLAETNLYHDPNTSLIKLRMLGEILAKYLFAYENIKDPEDDKAITRLHILASKGIIPDRLLPLFHSIRKIGNKATHEAFGSVEVAANHLHFAHRVTCWFHQTYGEDVFATPEYVLPAEETTDIEELRTSNEALRSRSAQLEADIYKLQTTLVEIQAREVPAATKKSRRKASKTFTNKMKLSEVETRQLIDEQLSSAGWLADTQNLRYSKGTRPQKGINIAIAEWPTSSGPADYVLFVSLKIVGVIEAKKKDKDVVADLIQAKRYAKDIKTKGAESFVGGPWHAYKVPFLFTTNGRPYLKQLEQKSGIWFLDGRDSSNHPRPLQAWYTPQGLLDLLQQDAQTAKAKLQKEPFDYLELRDYQILAIQKVEAGISEGKRALLLAMATGTGKTRMAIGLIYRLVKTGLFRRILFLVDRNALGEQAEDAFKETRLEDLHTFNQIFDLKGIRETTPEETTRVHISTVQAVVRRILFNANDKNVPTVDQYDCIVVDEAHRGYTLDKELGEVELLYRDEQDYISKYRKVLDYFDAVKVGLTATPAPHTADIFGKPVYSYSYREAVIDGWLIDHEPPHQLETKLKTTGITWKKGETIPVYDPLTNQISNLEDIADDLKLDVTQFNKSVITENFNRTIIKELILELDPEGEEKTLVFASTDDHADLIVKIFKEEFTDYLGKVDDDAIVKITGSIDQPLQMIRKYKNEKYPTIAVTVDLLTTGIDVPEICNLVFLRRVRSRILYEQMLGRATRRCDRIHKEHFNIFDAVGLYEALEPVTNMKAVAPGPKVTLQMLVDELFDIESEDHQKMQLEQLIAKLQRKSHGMNQEDAERFEILSEGLTLKELIDSLQGKGVAEAKKVLRGKQNLLVFLDENRYQPRKQLISHHEDKLASHTRGYGKGEKPEDYLGEFKSFILDNMNKIPALAIICQRPRDLTRQDLRKLKLALDEHGYSEPKLRTAWREWTNEDIAADIISFIRRQALGDPLVSQEERIRTAMQRVYNLKPWPKMQKTWLERIEKQLFAETIIERDDFDHGAFKAHGGFNRINKIFQGNLPGIMEEINSALYPEEKKYA
ncbi:MAG: type I restriction-modification system endonuclease [Desulfobulbaceae bacterium]|nr:type I restriction-modification system endonuclease [Desulfobulbaceae bacterium]